MMEDSGTKAHACDLCQKSFTRLSNLKEHMLTHSTENPKLHMHVRLDTKKHPCNVCNKTFMHSVNLRRHMKTHSGVRSHQCKVCNKTFTRSDYLVKHMHIHSDIKPHECMVCKLSFADRSNLRVHMDVHLGVKHHCEVCKKSFTRKENLKQHLLIHSGVKLHQCFLCHRSFSRSSHLTRHKLTHSVVKPPHQCDVCKRTFNLPGHLRRHERTAHAVPGEQHTNLTDESHAQHSASVSRNSCDIKMDIKEETSELHSDIITPHMHVDPICDNDSFKHTFVGQVKLEKSEATSFLHTIKVPHWQCANSNLSAPKELNVDETDDNTVMKVKSVPDT